MKPMFEAMTPKRRRDDGLENGGKLPSAQAKDHIAGDHGGGGGREKRSNSSAALQL